MLVTKVRLGSHLTQFSEVKWSDIHDVVLLISCSSPSTRFPPNYQWQSAGPVSNQRSTCPLSDQVSPQPLYHSEYLITPFPFQQSFDHPRRSKQRRRTSPAVTLQQQQQQPSKVNPLSFPNRRLHRSPPHNSFLLVHPLLPPQSNLRIPPYPPNHRSLNMPDLQRIPFPNPLPITLTMPCSSHPSCPPPTHHWPRHPPSTSPRRSCHPIPDNPPRTLTTVPGHPTRPDIASDLSPC